MVVSGFQEGEWKKVCKCDLLWPMASPDSRRWGNRCHLLMGGAATRITKGCGHSEAWLISGHDDLHLQHLVICMALCPFHSAFAGSWPPLSNKLQCCHVLPTTVTLAFILLYLMFWALIATCHVLHIYLCWFACLPPQLKSQFQESRAFIGFILCCVLSTQARAWHISDTQWILVACMNWVHSTDICVDLLKECLSRALWITLSDEQCLYHLGEGDKNNKRPHFPCQSCLWFNFFFKQTHAHGPNPRNVYVFFGSSRFYVCY